MRVTLDEQAPSEYTLLLHFSSKCLSSFSDLPYHITPHSPEISLVKFEA
jgi:hypothetical protein